MAFDWSTNKVSLLSTCFVCLFKGPSKTPYKLSSPRKKGLQSQYMHDLECFWSLNPDSEISQQNDGFFKWFFEIFLTFPKHLYSDSPRVRTTHEHLDHQTESPQHPPPKVECGSVMQWECSRQKLNWMKLTGSETGWKGVRSKNSGATGLAKSSEASKEAKQAKQYIRDLRWYTTLQLLTHSLCCLMPIKVLGDNWNLPCSLQWGKLTNELTDIHSILLYIII